MNERHIIDAINEKVRSVPITDKPNLSLTERYPYWYIGITNDPNERKAWHASNEADVKHWRSWPADTKAIARYVEKYFLDRDMRGAAGGGTNPTYVYIY